MGEIVPLSDSYEPVMNQFDIPVVLISTVLMLRRRFKGHIVAAVTFLFDSCYTYYNSYYILNTTLINNQCIYMCQNSTTYYISIVLVDCCQLIIM